MNDFSIKKIASEYIYRRFPKASVAEKEKCIRDWTNKMKDARALVQDFKERIGDPNGKKILDAGCGNGGISIAFSEAGALTYGVEIEKDLYEISKQHANALSVNSNFYLYDGTILPFEDNFFDFAVSASVLEHTDDPVFYLKQIFRVLKPEGMLYLGFPNKWTPRETHTQVLFLTYLPRFIRPFVIKILKRNPLEANNLHFYSYFDLENMLNHINIDGFSFKIIREEGKSQKGLKFLIKKILSLLGFSYKVFLPHILVVLKKSKI